MPISRQVHDEFAIRYYRWALADGRREVDQGLPLLRTVKDPGALATLQYLEGLTSGDCRSLLSAAIKRASPRALELSGESLTDRERELFNDYSNNIMPLVGTFLDKLMTDRYLAPDRKPKASKRRLAGRVKEKLQPCCGRIVSRDSAYLWSHLTVCEGWEIYTSIDMGGSPDLRYWHSIVQPGQTASLRELISLHTWLGFPSTEWSLLNESDESDAANSITRLCRHFLESVPALLNGLLH